MGMEFTAKTPDEAKRIVEAYLPIREIKTLRVKRKNANSTVAYFTFTLRDGKTLDLTGGFVLGAPGEKTLYNLLIEAGFSKDEAERVLQPGVSRATLYNTGT